MGLYYDNLLFLSKIRENMIFQMPFVIRPFNDLVINKKSTHNGKKNGEAIDNGYNLRAGTTVKQKAGDHNEGDKKYQNEKKIKRRGTHHKNESINCFVHCFFLFFEYLCPV